MTLTEQEKIFVAEYQVDFKPVSAARRAGYSKPRKDSNDLLGRQDILDAIAEGVARRTEELNYSAMDVLKSLVDIVNLDISDIMDDNGNLIPIRAWPKEWRLAVSGFDVTELQSKTEVMGVIKKIKIPDKLKTLELIGRHIEVQAWKDNSAIETTGSGIDVLHRKRLENPDNAEEE